MTVGAKFGVQIPGGIFWLAIIYYGLYLAIVYNNAASFSRLGNRHFTIDFLSFFSVDSGFLSGMRFNFFF